MGNFPNMSDAFFEWSNAMTFRVVTPIVKNFEVTEAAPVETEFQATVFPTNPQKVAVKPEGQRTWIWNTMVSTQLIELDTVVIDAAGIEYRVMSRNDYGAAGFYEYEIVEGFQG